MTDAEAIGSAARILHTAVGDRLRRSFPLAPLTTFRLGGPAALYLEPDSEEDLEAAGLAVRESGVPVMVLGKGSNVLVSDHGFEGLVLRLGRGYRYAARDGDVLSAGGSMPLPALAGVALSHGLGGLEFGVAIPATVGGAVRMNAGAHGGTMSEVLDRIEVYSLREGRAEAIAAGAAGFGYRHSALPEGAVVTRAAVRLVPEDRDEIRARMSAAREWRRRTQPLAEPNCGSVFKNPPGDHAARLVESAGAKGMRIGGASVSTKHANFIVADPGSRAVDVLELIRTVQARVEEETGVRLDTEVHLVGEFPPAA